MSIDHKISNSSIAEKLAKYTKYQREKHGMSLNEFAKLTGLTTSFLSRLEKKEYKDVKFDVITKLAEGFSMRVKDFLKKCEIIESHRPIYPLSYYFKELYQFPDEAIDDIRLFIKLLQQKYKKEIQLQKEAHKNYWKSEK